MAASQASEKRGDDTGSLGGSSRRGFATLMAAKRKALGNRPDALARLEKSIVSQQRAALACCARTQGRGGVSSARRAVRRSADGRCGPSIARCQCRAVRTMQARLHLGLQDRRFVRQDDGMPRRAGRHLARQCRRPCQRVAARGAATPRSRRACVNEKKGVTNPTLTKRPSICTSKYLVLRLMRP